MATVAPAVTVTSGVPRVTWANLATGDTITSLAVQGEWGLAASVQISGTFGGATVKLQHSNDGSNWFNAADMLGTAVSATSAAIFEVSLSSAYMKPAISGGAADAVNVIIVYRG